MAGICRARVEAFGTAGQDSEITPLPMADMAKR